MYWKIPIGADLSQTSYRAIHEEPDYWYIERNEGLVGEDWVRLEEDEIMLIAPEFFEEPVDENSTEMRLSRIENMVNSNYQQAKQEGSDQLLLELLERGAL